MRLSTSVLKYLKALYRQDASQIVKELDAYIKEQQIQTFPESEPDWYKCLHVYTVFADGIIYKQNLSPLKNLTLHLPVIKSMGFNAVHILPFLESPMMDNGYDVSDYYSVRKELGTYSDLLRLIKVAKELQLHLFMDFVLNHISEQHDWYKKAIQGEEQYRGYFIALKKKPKLLNQYCKNSAYWAEYKIRDKIYKMTIAFPEMQGELPHWRQEADGYWYYHTYYPQQPDVNWFNSRVFIEMAKVMIHWAALGFNFRLDAIYAVGLKKYKTSYTENKHIQLVLATLKAILKSINPGGTLLIESFENIRTIKSYFGGNNATVNLAYNFHLSTITWLSLIKNNINFVWIKLNSLKNIPVHAEWLNFLRNHDELSLAHLKGEHIKAMQKALKQYGKPFREDYGIAGRTFSLLGEDKHKALMAHFLLASYPGALMIPYGDEVLYKNTTINNSNKRMKVDNRNINRGSISASDYSSPKGKKFSYFISEILEHRNHLRMFFKTWPIRIKAAKEIYAAMFKYKKSYLIALVNLSNKEKKIKITTKDKRLLFYIHKVKLQEDHVILGPYAGIWIIKDKTQR